MPDPTMNPTELGSTLNPEMAANQRSEPPIR